MKFLDDAKNAKFANDLLAAAGFNLEELRKAGDANALKSTMEQKTVAGPTAADLEAAVKENQRLEAALAASATEAAAFKAAAKTQTQLSDALAANGIKISDASDDKGFSAEKFDAAFNLAVAKASRIALARAGHLALEEQVTSVTTAKTNRAPDGVTGRDRVRFGFDQQRYGRN